MNPRTPIGDFQDIGVPVLLAGMGGMTHSSVGTAVSVAGGYGALGMATPGPDRIVDSSAEDQERRPEETRPFVIQGLARLV